MDKLVKTKYGYYAVENPPSESELSDYYAKKYYQEARGSYEIEYDAEEISYINNKIEQRAYILDKHIPTNGTRTFLDIGCGEGWALNFFKQKGWVVLGLDYSSFGCEKFNPNCMENLISGNVYDGINKLIAEGRKFDVVWVDNVLEHVINPEAIIQDFKKIINPNGILVIEVPNDFSIVQNHAFAKGNIDKQYWVVIPDHLSYFSKESLENLLNGNGWQSITCLADYPIDWNLLNPNSNYIQKKEVGKSCHRERIAFENLIHTLPVEKVNSFYQALGDIGLGRLITGFFRPNQD